MRELDQTLRAMNPAPSGAPAEQARLDAILATPRGGLARRPRARSRWAWAAVAATVVLAALAYVALDPFGATVQPAFAVTPPPLRPVGADGTAAEVLEAMADKVGGQPDPRPEAWRTEHFVRDSWALSTRVDGIQVTSAVIVEHSETWEKPDGSARWKTRTLPPVFQNDAQRRVWERAGSVGAEPERSDDSSGPSTTGAGEPPATVEGMRKWLGNGRRPSAGLLFEVVPERFRDHVFSPAQRAALLRLLASTKGIVHAGTVRDRAGRTGEAFCLTDRSGGLPDKRTLVFDPATGDLLAYEEQLLENPGRLNVRPYAVIGYITFLTAERLP